MSDVEEPRVSRGLVILLAIVVGLAALYALYTFVIAPLLAPAADADPDIVIEVDPTGDDGADIVIEVDPDDEVTPGVTPAPGPPPVGPDPTDEPAEPRTEEPLPETFEIFSARDPFQQLVVVPAVATGGATTPGTGTTGTASPQPTTSPSPGTTGTASPGATPSPTASPSPGATTGPSPSPGTGPSPSPGTGGGTEPPDTTVGETRIELVDVFTDDEGDLAVLVNVDGTSHEANEGETFAGNFQVLDISGRCATFLFGDSRFTLCEGEQIVK